MEIKEERVDLSIPNPPESEKGKQQAQLVFKLNHTMPMTEEYTEVLNELFEDRIGEGSYVAAPIQGACLDRVTIGKNVFINSNSLMMSRGGITIEDDVLIAANVSLISNNHDPYERQVLLCKPVLIRQGAWIGAGATVLPGVTAGNPARVIRMLDASRFE